MTRPSWYDRAVYVVRCALLFVLAAAFVTVAAVGAEAQRATGAERFIARAEQALAQGKRTRATALLRTGHLRHPGNLQVLARLTDLLLQAEACPARRELNEADRLTAKLEEPDDAADKRAHRHVQVGRAIIDACLGQVTSEALESTREDARRGDVDARTSLARLGLIYVRAHALPAAERWLSVAHELSPEDLSLGRDYAAVLLALGRSHDATRVLSLLYRRAPTDLALLRDYAGALTAAGRAEDALALFEAARDTCRELPACVAQAGRTALEAGEPAHALTWLEEAGDRVALLMVRGDALSRLGRLEEARATYRRILVVEPTHKRAKQALATLEHAASE